MAKNTVITISQAAAESSSYYTDGRFRVSDHGFAQINVFDYTIGANTGVALAAALKSNLMTLPEGARVKAIIHQPVAKPAGGNAAGSLKIGHVSSNTDRLASDDDHWMAATDLTGLTNGALTILAPLAPPTTVDATVWFVSQEFPVPVDIQMVIAAGYKADAAVTGYIIIVWEP